MFENPTNTPVADTPGRLKITFILPFAALTGGVRVVALYATELAARGHDVRVVSQPAATPRLKERVKALLQGSKPSAPVASTLFTPLGDRHKILPDCRPVTAADVEDADFIVATWWETAEWVAKLPASKGRKLYLLQGYEMFPNMPHERVAATYSAGLHMMAVSSFVRDTISRKHGVTGIDLQLNGVDTAHFDTSSRERGAPLTVGFMFQHTAIKNMPLALEAIRRARDIIPDLNVIAFGANPANEFHPLPDYVRLEVAPPQQRIPEIYASCDAWIVPSIEEGFGLPLLEAMACRTPVLATRFGASEDIVADGHNGWLLPHDPDAFVEKLLLLDRMPASEWKRMSDAARATALSWDWAGRVDAFEEKLRILDAKARPLAEACMA